MLTTVMLAMTLGAPVPPSLPTAPAGPAPRLVELKPNADGKVLITVTRVDKVKVQAAIGIAIAPGGAAPPPPQPVVREITVNKAMTVELGDVKELTITTTDGKKLDVADALKRLKSGAVVIVSANGKPVSPQYLKLFKDDVLVLASPELIGTPRRSGRTTPGFPGNAIPGGPVQIAPLPPAVQPAPGVIQIQIQPGVQVGQPKPAVAPAPRK